MSLLEGGHPYMQGHLIFGSIWYINNLNLLTVLKTEIIRV
jgi:hypothetical protein